MLIILTKFHGKWKKIMIFVPIPTFELSSFFSVHTLVRTPANFYVINECPPPSLLMRGKKKSLGGNT